MLKTFRSQLTNNGQMQQFFHEMIKPKITRFIEEEEKTEHHTI